MPIPRWANKQLAVMRRSTLARFVLSGMVFTFLGPFLFWSFYSLGPLLVFVLAEGTTHSLRFLAFEHFVFPGDRSRREALVRYLVAVVPVSIGGLLLVATLAPSMDRNRVVLIGLFYGITAGFLWARRVYRPGSSRSHLP